MSIITKYHTIWLSVAERLFYIPMGDTRMKKITALVLVVIMVFVMLPATVVIAAGQQPVTKDGAA